MSEPDAWDPGSPENRERTQETKRQMRRLPMEWDPIGVTGIPEAADEYDCMISPLLHLLFEGADIRSLVGWISHERSSHFGLGPDEAEDMRLAESLAAWWERRRIEATLLSGHSERQMSGSGQGYVSDTISVAMPRGFAADYAHF
jgi:hypothetical protein